VRAATGWAAENGTALRHSYLSADPPLIWLGPESPLRSQSSALSHTYPICRPPLATGLQVPAVTVVRRRRRLLCLIGQVRH